MRSTPLVYLPAELPRASVAEVGGKAYSLIRLREIGAPVPPLAAVTWRAMSDFLALNGIEWRAFDDWPDLRSRMAEAPIPERVLDPVLQAYETLVAEAGASDVAVRSSAVGEDSTSDSFAGQHVTVLGVAGEQGLQAALKQCWLSYVSEAAVAYRQSRKLGWPEKPDLAVILQAQLMPDKAGVAFTRHPVLPELNSVCIEANFGTGESVVGGMVTPDSATVSRSSGLVQEYRISNKSRMTVVEAGGSGSSTVELDLPQRTARVLSDEEAQEVARMALEVEEAFGAPQDVEWAVDSRGLWILQARPITTLEESL